MFTRMLIYPGQSVKLMAKAAVIIRQRRPSKGKEIINQSVLLPPFTLKEEVSNWFWSVYAFASTVRSLPNLLRK